MFSRSPPPEQKSKPADLKPFELPKAGQTSPPPVPALVPDEPETTSPPRSAPPIQAPRATPGSGAGFSMGSLIGNDLTISGQGLKISTRGTLQVDGRVEGDVIGSEVIVGEHGHVTGMVQAERVIVRGKVHGTVRGLSVTLASGSHVEGDVHHRELSVEQGAHLDGRVRRPQDVNDLKPVFDPPPAKAA